MVAQPAFDLVIVGGGVIGLASAWQAAQRGLTVAVVDPTPGRGASWVAAGMLAPVTEAAFGEGPLTQLLVAAAARWPAFAGALEALSGLPVGYRTCGTVAVAVDASDRLAVDQLLELHHRLGLASTRLSGRECRAMVPALSPGIRGGAEVPGDHQVDNRLLLAALAEAGRRAGVVLVADLVVAVEVGPGGRVSGVRPANGEVIGAGNVLLAAGASPRLPAGIPSGLLPSIRPVKGHVVRLRSPASEPWLERTVRGLVHGRTCYLVPRADGSVVVGATSTERGYDTSVQAGAVYALLEDARALVPGIDELELVECIAGLRPASPDNGPVVGWTDLPGLLIAGGHFRNGILLAPLTAETIAALVAGDQSSPALGPWGPQRFSHSGRAAQPVGAS